MPKKLSEKKKFKRIRLLSSSSDEEENCVQTDPGYKSSDTSPLQVETICNLDNVDVTCDRKEIVVASSKNEYCNDNIENACTDVLTSYSCNSSKQIPEVCEFGPGLKLLANIHASIEIQIEQMHYYLRSMLKEKIRQEKDVADFEKLQRKLELLGMPAKGLEIVRLKKEFKKKAKVLGAKFLRCLKQAMTHFENKQSYLTVIFVKILKLFSNNNKIPNSEFIIKCRIAIHGMIELNRCEQDIFKVYFITMEEMDFIRVIKNAWQTNNLASDIAKDEIVLND